MAKNNNLTDLLADIADAIRQKRGTTELINPQDFSQNINAINTVKNQSKNVSLTSNKSQTISPDSGYTGLSSVTVNPMMQEKTVWIEWDEDVDVELTSDNGYLGLDKVTLKYRGPIDSSNYLTIEPLEDGCTVSLTKSCEYSIDRKGVWTALEANTATPPINVGQVISFKAINPNTTNYDERGVGSFSVSKRYKVKGRLLSMLHGDDINNNNPQQEAFFRIFKDSTTLIDASELILVAPTAKGLYEEAFMGCVNLVTSPELPNTTKISEKAYYQMFYDCKSLTSPAVIITNNIGNYACTAMFMGCTSLTSATIAFGKNYNGKYSSLASTFARCTSLRDVSISKACGSAMFMGCTSLTSVDMSEVTYIEVASYMFENCTNLEQVIFSDNIEYYGPDTFKRMFYGCTSLKEIPKLRYSANGDKQFLSMFENCTSLERAELPATGNPYARAYERMFYGCSNLSYIKAMFTFKPQDSISQDWVFGVSEMGTFVKNSAATWENTYSPSTIPEGWFIEYADA